MMKPFNNQFLQDLDDMQLLMMGDGVNEKE